MSLLDFSVNIIVAVVLGAIIGVERQWRQRLAGLRTNALVALGAAAFVAMSAMLSGALDLTRIAAQVVSGIGFLAGGVILREGLSVRGLNTAATLWCTAAVGTLAGLGFIAAATLATGVVIGANVALRPLGHLINRQPMEASEVEVAYRLQATCLDTEEQHIRALLLQAVASDALVLKSLRSEEVPDSKKVQVKADIVTAGRNDRLIEEITARLSMEPGTKAISWESGEPNGKDQA